MKKLFEGFVALFLGVIFGLFLIITLSLHPQPQSPYNYETTSRHYDINQKQAISRSVNSSVRVISMNTETGMVSALSGTYFTVNGNFYVLTSAHGIHGDCEDIGVFSLNEMAVCIEIVKIDREVDYVIFEVGKLSNRKPLKIPNALANWKKSYNLLDKTYYTGYPNNVGPTSWTGNISGFTGEYVIIQTYAWSGSSGSGVFDERGQLIGIIMALDVGQSMYGTQILNNLVIVIPIWKIDFSSLTE